MKGSTRSQRFVLPALFALALLGSGCATLLPPSGKCEQFKTKQKKIDYDTTYRLLSDETKSAASNFRPLPKGWNASARLYRVHISPEQTTACDHLVIHKELYLQRLKHPRLIVEELREIYTADGVLIADKKENLSQQLDATGYYIASVPLPIPEGAPAGTYRIVNKILLRWEGRKKSWRLNETSVNFRVVSP